MTNDSCVELLVECLGVTEVDANEEIVDVYSFRLDWIKQHCQGAPANVSAERLDQCSRGYLLYILRCTIFSDKT